MEQGLVALEWDDVHESLWLLDQRDLPEAIDYMPYKSMPAIAEAIKDMVVRGAPAIGVTAAYGMYFAAKDIRATDYDDFLKEFRKAGKYLASARPTAVNLAWAVGEMLKVAEANKGMEIRDLVDKLLAKAVAIHREDERICYKIGENLLELLHDGMGLLTHCNAGQLATSRYGTATAPMYLAKERGWNFKVYSDETRPRLQGSTLTAFELHRAGIDVTTITDNMAAVVMSQGKIDAVIVGTDRVAANGDVANKVGTLGVSILAKYYGIPFYVAAPTPSIDMNTATGADIPIEERDPAEVGCTFGVLTVPKGVKIYNPSFDVTPAANITAIVTEKGVVYPPLAENLAKLFQEVKDVEQQ